MKYIEYYFKKKKETNNVIIHFNFNINYLLFMHCLSILIYI